jgi:HSP20 family protein
VESGKRNDLFAEWRGEPGERLRGDRWEPAIDVYETEKSIVVRVELAGVENSDLRVTIDGSVVRLRGVRQPRLEADAQRLHQMEIAFGPFERAIRIPIPFEREHVSAHLEEGFLRVILPKRVPVRRRIQVTAEKQ